MKAILFNGEVHPKQGDVFVVSDVYPHFDAMYGPQTAVVLTKLTKKTPEAKFGAADRVYDER